MMLMSARIDAQRRHVDGNRTAAVALNVDLDRTAIRQGDALRLRVRRRRENHRREYPRIKPTVHRNVPPLPDRIALCVVFMLGEAGVTHQEVTVRI